VKPNSNLSYHLLLHFIVFIWGFTGILGKLISLDAYLLVWYRMAIATLGIYAFLAFKGIEIKIGKEKIAKQLFVGLIVALHWITFFEAIKVSNVSVTLACFAATSLFTALMEPIFFKRKLIFYEIILGVITVFGIYLIFRFEGDFFLGIVLSLFSASLASLFTVFNGIMVKETRARVISFYEMSGGFIGISLYMLLAGEAHLWLSLPALSDMIYLLILGLVCTAFAFVASVDIMKVLSPFTVSISVNLEPVYSIGLAILIFGDSEKMKPGFYAGASIVLLTVLANAYLKNRYKTKTITT
jgi:drug/metabolite transporter (DMT)-like permease